MLIPHLEVPGQVFELVFPLLVLFVLGVIFNRPVVRSGGIVEAKIQIAVINCLLDLKPSSNFKHVLN